MRTDQIIALCVILTIPVVALLIYKWLKKYSNGRNDIALILIGLCLFSIYGLTINYLLGFIVEDPKESLFSELLFTNPIDQG